MSLGGGEDDVKDGIVGDLGRETVFSRAHAGYDDVVGLQSFRAMDGLELNLQALMLPR
jgi:hypothetical protein